MEGLPYCENIVKGKRLLIEFLQELMHARTVHVIRCAFLEGILRIIIPDRIDLGEHVEHIEAEAVDSFIQPEIQDVDDLFPDFRILPVQVCLFLAEKMQVELILPFRMI